jgi:hypothetical protein
MEQQMMKMAAIAILLAIAGMSTAASVSAGPLSPIVTASKLDDDRSIVVRAGSRHVAPVHRGHLGSFRPSQVSRVRPLAKVRPLVHPKVVRPQRHGKFAHRKRPRPHTLHMVPPEVRVGVVEYYRDDLIQSPDVCGYWSERGELRTFGEPCFW